MLEHQLIVDLLISGFPFQIALLILLKAPLSALLICKIQKQQPIVVALIAKMSLAD